MKLRFRGNSLRFRLNKPEADRLGSGVPLREVVSFPGSTEICYLIETADVGVTASFKNGTIRITVPRGEAALWADTDAVGMYFDLSADGASLRIAIEKDLECVDGPEEERDPEAFPRGVRKNC